MKLLPNMNFLTIVTYYCINTLVTRYQQPFITDYARYLALLKAHANNENLKSAWNEHKNESFYAYENVMRL